VPQRIKRLRHVVIVTPALTDAVHSDAVAIRLASIFTPLLFPDRRVSPIENAIFGTTSSSAGATLADRPVELPRAGR
jgi:hypothetical protein